MKKSPLAILAVTLFIDLLGFGLILPLLPVYIRHYGGQPWVGGMLLACFSVMQFVFSPIWGRVSDRYGRRPMILMSLCGSAISFLAFGLAPNLAVLFLARVAAGILSAASLPTAQAYIADVTTPEKRASGMAVLGASFGLGFALGPLIGGYFSRFSLFGGSPLSTPAYVAALLCLLNFLWALFMLPESHFPSKEAPQGGASGERKGARDLFASINRALFSPTVGPQLLVFAFATFAFTAVESSFSWLVLLRFNLMIHRSAEMGWAAGHHALTWSALPVHQQQPLIEKAQAAATTQIFMVVGMTILVVQGLVMGGLARRIGENRLVMFGAGLLTFALLGIGLAQSFTVILFLSAAIAIGNGVLNPSLSALITQSAGPEERGTLSGAQQGLGSLARIIAPPINNSLVQVHTGIPFFGSAALMCAAFLLSLRLKPLIQQAKSPTAEPPTTRPVAAPTVEIPH